MSLGPVKPVMHSVPTAISEAPKEHAKEDDTPEHDENQDQKEAKRTASEKKDEKVQKILKTAIEAEAPKVNILNDRGEKVVPDISGMVINILT